LPLALVTLATYVVAWVHFAVAPSNAKTAC